FFFTQKTAYEIVRWLEFRRVLFRSVLGALHAAAARDDDLRLGQLGQAGGDLLAPLHELHPGGGDLDARLLHGRALARLALGGLRSEERRVGQEGVERWRAEPYTRRR